MTKPILFPCPFCGGEADYGNTQGGGVFVNCIECLASTNHLFPNQVMSQQQAADLWNTRTDQLVDAGVPGVLIIEVDRLLTTAQRETFRHALKASLPDDYKALVLEQGMKVARPDDARLARIEARLDQLVTALAEDEPEGDDGDPRASLDGGRVPARAPVPTL